MNAVEIEEAVSELAGREFDPEEFPFAFLEAFGNKATTIKRLRAGATNKSDVGGLLQRNQIHLAVSEPGRVGETLAALRESPATEKAKAKFILATDGESLEAEDRVGGETLACEYRDLPDHFGFFLALAGISTVREVRENAFDIKATARLNRLYVQLLQDNPDWAGADHREAMNHFMARLIFCFFAEDTSIFSGDDLFTDTVSTMSASGASNMHEVIGEIFRAMNVRIQDREEENVARWAKAFPYVNGGLFAGGFDVPKFSKIARSYLIHIGSLDWTKINPDIFGSMIQAVADDEERGNLGMHYTSVPNILKVLDPLFLDDLREQLEVAGDNARKLLNLRKRIARIRVFDPACGSGNFLVIAYKQLRAMENEINERRGEAGRSSDIHPTNFRGVELRHFSTEIARLALIIAQFQCDVEYLGQRKALLEFLPLATDNWITCGNALRLDWLGICPSTGESVKLRSDDLFETPLDQAEIDFGNEGGELYVCGNPPYIGTKYQTKNDKADLAEVFAGSELNFGNADYVFGWVKKGAHLVSKEQASALAFVTTNSLYEGEQAEIFYWVLKKYSLDIEYAHTGFKWSNNAANNAGVTCCITKLNRQEKCRVKRISNGETARAVKNIGPYLVEMPDVVVRKERSPISDIEEMKYGSMSNDGGNFTVSDERFRESLRKHPRNSDILRYAVGGAEFVKGIIRRTIYIPPEYQLDDEQKSEFSDVFDAVRKYRSASKRAATAKLASVPYLYAEPRQVDGPHVFVPQILSESREYLTVGLLSENCLVIAPHMQIRGCAFPEFSLLSSKLHLVWISTVCGKLETRYRYSNTLGWNTFPVPRLTDKNKADLALCAERILIAREHNFPATIADLYAPENMPSDLREAHEQNDEILERIFIGRRFRNDTERLEKLFEMYAEMTAPKAARP